jgi:ribose transport system ATP-binding protein
VAAAASNSPLRLAARGIHKRYNVPVLTDFDFTLVAGEVHALVGSNGAGKSTFARILCGLTPASAGTLQLDGMPYDPASKSAATAAGVVMVLQELNLIPTLSVAENLSFEDLPARFGFIDRAELRQRARAALALVGLDHLDPDQPAGALGVGQQQLVEIAAALTRECRVLILDEPSAALTATEAEELFARIRDLQAQGVAVIYVSHRMDEIRRIADRVTVLRDGRHIATHEAKQLDLDELIREMAGSALAAAGAKTKSKSATPATGHRSPEALAVRGLNAPPLLHDINLQVHAGEIVGIAGLVGAGRTELLRAIYGADPIASGQIELAGKVTAIPDPTAAVRAGIGMVPEDRKADGLLLPQSILANTTLASHDRLSRHGWMDTSAARRTTLETTTAMALKYDDLDQPVSELSGGNQQKAVIARWLLRDTAVLLLDEPTRGVDAAAKESIYELMAALAARGKALLMVSSELPELMANCDRILVMSTGRIVGEFTPADWSEERITAAAFAGHMNT